VRPLGDGGLDRRAFLQVSATAAGGLALSVTIGCRPKHQQAPAVKTAPEAVSGATPKVAVPGHDLDAYIHIGADDTVTFQIAEAEMGQGTMTGLAMILAEDLDADWSKVRAEHAPTDPAKYGEQSTGGSSSIRRDWEPLRKVGATARAMLIGAAAAEWGVPASELTTEPGVVVHAASKRRARYGQLAAKAAAIAPPADPPLKDPTAYRLVGTPQKRLDTPAKAAGKAVFGLDVRLPGMLVAQIEKSPTLGGAVRTLDASKALAVPGVRQVFEVPGGVAVVADHFWAATKGRAALAVTWDPGPNAGLDSKGISATLRKLAETGGALAAKRGDPTRGLRRARHKVAAVYEVPYLAHATMEPLNCTAHVTDGACELWVGTQAQTSVQHHAAEQLGIAPEKVTIHTTFLGGGFGRRSQTDFIADAVEVARKVKAPVKLVRTREDDMRAGFYRPAVVMAFEGGLDKDGWPTAWVNRIAAPSILEQFRKLDHGIDGTAVEGAANMPYDAVPDFLCTYAKASLPVSIWFWRSVGSSHNAYATECFLDELARAGGKDPLEVRRRLLAGKPRHRAVLDAAAAAAGYGKPLPAGHAHGLAVHESFGSFVAEVAEVSIEGGRPRVHKVTCAVDCGKQVNPAQIVAQMESAITYGLSAALYGAIHVERGRIVEENFDGYPLVRISTAPAIDVHLVPSGDDAGGIGEPGTPPIAPAVCNAILALTGKPVRTLPIKLA
jgi:isoquinoline 1-oxidoreductase subunit beta